MKVSFPEPTKETPLKLLPCRECGSEKIELSDEGYSSFNIFNGKCLGCGLEVSGTCGCLPTRDDLVYMWNRRNTPEAKLAAVLSNVKAMLDKGDIDIIQAQEILRKAMRKPRKKQ